MEIIRSLTDFKPLESSVLTIGSYDGIHRGHYEILSAVVNHAHARKTSSVIITFNPHPRHILENPLKKIPLLMSMEQKIKILKKIGIDFLYIIKFTKPFSITTPEDFLEKTVIPNFNPKYIIIGYDHHFGKNRKGNPEFLNSYCAERSIGVEVIKQVSDVGHNISSTRIRELIRDGYIRRANFELGSVYGFKAKVVRGSGRGKKLKFPTANVVPNYNNQLMPKPGVYFIRGRIIGLKAFGMCNFGTRPTFNEDNLIMEVHFFYDKLQNLYGKEIRVEFLERIRDEKKFPSPEQLVTQLKKDKKKCLELQGKYE